MSYLVQLLIFGITGSLVYYGVYYGTPLFIKKGVPLIYAFWFFLWFPVMSLFPVSLLLYHLEGNTWTWQNILDHYQNVWLISIPTGRFVAPALLPLQSKASWGRSMSRFASGSRANTMLVTKALSQDVMLLAFVPLLLIPKESPSRNEGQLFT